MRYLPWSFLLLTALARAELPAEPLGQVESLPQPFGSGWFWASDPILECVALVDFGNNRVLGSVDSGCCGHREWAGQYAPYSVEEVTILRKQPLTDISGKRSGFMLLLEHIET